MPRKKVGEWFKSGLPCFLLSAKLHVSTRHAELVSHSHVAYSHRSKTLLKDTISAVHMIQPKPTSLLSDRSWKLKRERKKEKQSQRQTHREKRERELALAPIQVLWFNSLFYFLHFLSANLEFHLLLLESFFFFFFGIFLTV